MSVIVVVVPSFPYNVLARSPFLPWWRGAEPPVLRLLHGLEVQARQENKQCDSTLLCAKGSELSVFDGGRLM